MAIDWGTTLSDTGTGAAAGTAVLPGIGTAIGAAGGFLAGILGGKKDAPPKFNDPNAWQRDYASRELLDSNIGAKQAAGAAGQEMNFARDQAEEASNNPMLAGNASAQAGIRNKLLMGAQRGAQSAYLGGAQIDSNNKAKGAEIAADSSRMAQSTFAMNQAYADRPGFGEQLFKGAISTAVGLGTAALGKSGSGDSAEPNNSTSGNANVGADTSLGKFAQSGFGNSGYSMNNVPAAPQLSSYGSQQSVSDSSWRGLFGLPDDSSNQPGDISRPGNTGIYNPTY